VLVASVGVTPDDSGDETRADGNGTDEQRADRDPADATDQSSSGDRTVTVLGVDVVLEAEFVTFPWRAGMKRAPVAFAATFLIALFLASFGGFGSGPLADRFALLGIIVYNVHNIHAATGGVPGLLSGIAQPLSNVPVFWRLFRGAFTVGPQHGSPLHLLDIVAGETGTIGHTNLAKRSAGEIPLAVYYAIPPVVLTATGYEFADSYWDDAVTDSPLELIRFGLALAAGYLLVLLLGTVVFTVELTSTLTGQTFIVLPDRYMTVVFGLIYPAAFGTIGAAIVYLQRS
jgi:hypothetical protein